MVYYPMLVTQMHKKWVLQPTPTQNIQMMRFEPRNKYPNVNIMLRSGTTTGEDKGKQLEEETWVHKAPTKGTKV